MARQQPDDDEMIPREVFRTTLPGFTLILVALFLIPAGLKVVSGQVPSTAIGVGEIIALLIGALAIGLLVGLRQGRS